MGDGCTPAIGVHLSQSLVRHAQRCSCGATLFGDNDPVSLDLLMVKCAPLIKYKSQEQYIVPLYLIRYLKVNQEDNKNSSQVMAARMKSATSSEQLGNGRIRDSK